MICIVISGRGGQDGINNKYFRQERKAGSRKAGGSDIQVPEAAGDRLRLSPGSRCDAKGARALSLFRI